MYRPEPPFAHDRAARLGVLLVNLGTPDAPTPSRCAAISRSFCPIRASSRFRACAVEADPARRDPAHHGPRKSAQRYATIWTKDGSPLLVHSLRQKRCCMGYLGQR